MIKTWHAAISGLVLCVSACDGESAPTEPADAEVPALMAEPKPELRREQNDKLVFHAGKFTVPAGQETYSCWTLSTDEALKIGAFGFPGTAVVHHTQLSRTATEEPEGVRDCPILFNSNWTPIFSTGAGKTELAFPEGVAYDLPAHTQLTLQLHLLNSSEKDVTDATSISIQLTDARDTQSVVIGGFGTTKIALPPRKQSSAGAACTAPHAARLIALNPHMHELGRSLTLEHGTSSDAMNVIYSRDPYDFQTQHIEPFELQIEQGQHLRVTCNFDNTTDQVISYGESTMNEMCFLGAYYVGEPVNCVER